MFTLDEIGSLLGEEAKEIVARKRRGGDNAERGADFELEYALARIAASAIECIERGEDGSQFQFEAQACCFLDDLLVVRPGLSIFSQIKDVQQLTWSGRLAEDCRNQRALNVAAGIAGSLEIVVSRETVRMRLVETRPGDLADVDVLNPEELFNRFPEAAVMLCEPFTDPSTIRNCRVYLTAAWHDLGRKARLNDLLDRCSELSFLAVRSLKPDYILPDDIRGILEGVTDIRFWTRGLSFFYEFEGGRGVAPYECGTERWAAFEERLRIAPPSDFITLFESMRDTQ